MKWILLDPPFKGCQLDQLFLVIMLCSQILSRVLTTNNRLINQRLVRNRRQLQSRESEWCCNLIHLSIFRRVLVVFVVTMHNIVDLTETNTQDSSSLGSIFSPEQFQISPFIQLMDNDHTRNSKQKFKISPTRIKFSNARESIAAIDIPTSLDRLSRDPNRILHPLVGSSNFKSNEREQMAPAYELWPDLNGDENLVKLNQQRAFGLNHQNDVENSNLNSYEPAERMSIAPNTRPFNSIRDVIPKPVKMAPSEVAYRSIKIRSLSDGLSHNDKQNKSRYNKEDDDYEPTTDEEVSNNGEDQSLMPNEANDNETNEQDNEPDVDIGRRSDNDVNRSHINFKTFGDEHAIEKAESRKLTHSPIYPPGDLDILYSDALLVYVKDFNQYIKRR